MRRPLLILSFLVIFQFISAQSGIEGTWQAIDDQDGKPTSYVEIKEIDSKVHGHITKLFNVEETVVCELCDGEHKDKPVLGMNIIWDMKLAKDEWKGGQILDPKTGNTYKCKITQPDDNTLKVRGYIGMPALGRTQTWYRVK